MDNTKQLKIISNGTKQEPVHDSILTFHSGFCKELFLKVMLRLEKNQAVFQVTEHMLTIHSLGNKKIVNDLSTFVSNMAFCC